MGDGGYVCFFVVAPEQAGVVGGFAKIEEERGRALARELAEGMGGEGFGKGTEGRGR